MRRSSKAGTLGLSLAALALVLSTLAPSPPAQADRTRARASSHTRAPRRVRFVPRISAAQRRQIQSWHRAASREEVRAWSRRDPPPLVLRPLHLAERFVLLPDARGRFDAEALARAEEALAYRVDDARHPIHPRLLELVYRAVRRFRAPYVWVISGYRDGNPRSRHAAGRAMDIVLPGVSSQRLAAYLRPMGFVGVGIYPTSGFVHLDVRARSYFWSDASGPGQARRERRILASLGPRLDRVARARGEEPVADVEDEPDESSGEAASTSPIDDALEAASTPSDAAHDAAPSR